jgi:hypothetical protein
MKPPQESPEDSPSTPRTRGFEPSGPERTVPVLAGTSDPELETARDSWAGIYVLVLAWFLVCVALLVALTVTYGPDGGRVSSMPPSS